MHVLQKAFVQVQFPLSLMCTTCKLNTYSNFNNKLTTINDFNLFETLRFLKELH